MIPETDSVTSSDVLSAPVPIEGGALLLHKAGHLIILTGGSDATGLNLPLPLPAPRPDHLPAVPAASRPNWELLLSCAGRLVRLNCWGVGMAGLRHRLSPLAIAETGEAAHVVDLVTDPQAQLVYIDGVLVEAVVDRPEAAAIIYVRLLELAMQPKEPLLVAHAAGLVVAGRPVLLIGSSGAGKTCLSTMLMTRGAALLSDDTVAVSRGCHGLHGLPVALRFRPPGWALIAPYLPSAAPAPRRLKSGITALAPQDVGRLAGTTGRAYAVILLDRRSDATSGLVSLSPAEGLAGLITAGGSITGHADADLCRELAQWASATRFFRLSYEGLEQGAELLETLDEGQG